MNKPNPPYRQALGKQGELLAAQYLQKRGWRVIERNFKARYGELDIVALDAGTLVFVEVKTRIGDRYGKPEEAVTSWKLREVIQTAQYYALVHPDLPQLLRIDVIGIQLDHEGKSTYFNHIKNVTM